MAAQAIVSFHEDVSWEEVQLFSDQWDNQGLTSVMDLPMINALVIKVEDVITLKEMALDPRVLAVEDDQKLQWKGVASKRGNSFIKKAERLEKKQYPWGILKLYGYYFDDTLGYVDKDLLPENIEFTLENLDKHKDLRIAVFDSGVYHEHKYLKDVVKGGIDLINPIFTEKGKKKGRKAAPLDDNGHGTHVSGILAASLDKDFEWGKKAKIELYVAKVLDQNATGDLSNIVMALQWAIDNDIDIINMSIGYRQDNLALRKAIQEAHKAGIIMIASSGNRSNYDDSVILYGLGDGGSGDGGSGDGGSGDGGSGDGGSGDGGSGDGGSGDGGSGDGGSGDGGSGVFGTTQALPLYSTMYPARYPEVIAVAASDFEGYLASYSNYDDKVDIMAPGSEIVSADITNGDMEEGGGVCSGTSMAAPHVTAAVAMMLSLDPTLNSEDIRDILKDTADYRMENIVGELDLNMALENVFSRILDTDASAIEKKELEKTYKKKIKEKLASLENDLWE
jgi:subtilisin family serine protease